jgi:tRNA dimethylallyltransferase
VSEVVAVVGPTATGKSDLAVRLALELGGEVVNADASQLYRGMDIGTAKLDAQERQGIPHHQLDVLDVTQEATVAAYQTAARADIDAILARGRVPVLVGGSGLYVRAALDRLDIPPTDPSVRARLEAELAASGVEPLRERLRAADPAAAAAIEPRNERRIVRALEVVELTGRPFSATMPTREHLRPTTVIGLRAARDVLDERIAVRTRRMWDRGLLEEVSGLVGQGLRDGRTASRAIGYRQALAQLDRALGEDEAVEQTTALTRRLVRRQESWFRPDPRIRWVDVTTADPWHEAWHIVSTAIGDNG